MVPGVLVEPVAFEELEVPKGPEVLMEQVRRSTVALGICCLPQISGSSIADVVCLALCDTRPTTTPLCVELSVCVCLICWLTFLCEKVCW